MVESELVQAINNIANNVDALAQPRFIDWLAVVLSIFSIVISGAAIWFAVRVPKTIADRQNKITLFEKRHDSYSAILSLEVFARALDQKMFQKGARDENGNIIPTEYKVGLCCVKFAGAFGYYPKVNKEHFDFDNMTQTLSILKQYEIRAMALVFLFHTVVKEEEEIREELSKIFEPLLCFMTEVSTYDPKTNSTINDIYRRDFIAALKKFKSKYAERLERELEI